MSTTVTGGLGYDGRHPVSRLAGRGETFGGARSYTVSLKRVGPSAPTLSWATTRKSERAPTTTSAS